MTRAQCPRCGKPFSNAGSVVQHLNKTTGPCANQIEDLVRLSDIHEEICALRASNSAPSSKRADYASRAQVYAQTQSPPSSNNGPAEMDVDADQDSSSYPATFTVKHPTAARIMGSGGPTFMSKFRSDEHAPKRTTNLYYPFASRMEWELASFLLGSTLSMHAIDQFLRIQLIMGLRLSFKSAKELRDRAEMLPKTPPWKSKPCTTVYKTKRPLTLYYRDPIECIQSILQNPLMQDALEFHPMQVFRVAQRSVRVYSNWLTGSRAWDIQDKLPTGATLLGTLVSSDETQISAMTGGRVSHPLLLSLANFDWQYLAKASNHAFLLLCQLPIAKFINCNAKMTGVLEARLFHECLDFVFEPLKVAARIGSMMSDPVGNQRLCYTPLATYILDTPEAGKVAGVMGKTSVFTVASHKTFGDPVAHETRLGSSTVSQIMSVEEEHDPWKNLPKFRQVCMDRFRLSGVHRPFFRNWAHSDPSQFLGPEPLHYWHKFFFDHVLKWAVNALGANELDFRFSIMQPPLGYRSFLEGVSALQQCTGRDHRNIQRYIVAIIGTYRHKKFTVTVRSVLDAFYFGQAPALDDNNCETVDDRLRLFHANKDVVLELGLRRNPKGKPINNWYIPKLESFLSITRHTKANGVPERGSADPTERAHITCIKKPARAGNNKEHEAQICCALDRTEKCRQFDLATSIAAANIKFAEADNEDYDDDDDTQSDPGDGLDCYIDSASLLTKINPVSQLTGTSRKKVDNFALACHLVNNEVPQAPTPFRTFTSAGDTVAFHLSRDPIGKRMTVDEAAKKYQLPDLRQALAGYYRQVAGGNQHVASGGRRTTQQALPFDLLEVWGKVYVQNKSFHSPSTILEPQAVLALPPGTPNWPLGRCDAMLMNTDEDMKWPWNGFKGHSVVQLRLIMRPVLGVGHDLLHDPFLTYVQRFNIIPQAHPESQSNPAYRNKKGPYPEPTTNLYALNRAKRADGTRLGLVAPLSQMRAPVNLVARSGDAADVRLAPSNYLEYTNEFWLNSYFHKEFFWAMNLST